MLCIPYLETQPVLKPGSRVAPNATAIGNVTVEKGASIWYGAVVRAENLFIHIGEDANVQDNVIMHTSLVDAVSIGDRASIGHGTIVHGSKVGNNSLIGMGSILMDGSVIGENCLVAAGSVVTQGTVIPDGSLVVGSPAKVKRPLTQKEIEGLTANCNAYLRLSRNQLEEIL